MFAGLLFIKKCSKSATKTINVQSQGPISRVQRLLAGIYLLKLNNRNTRTRCEICSKLTIETPE